MDDKLVNGIYNVLEKRAKWYDKAVEGGKKVGKKVMRGAKAVTDSVTGKTVEKAEKSLKKHKGKAFPIEKWDTHEKGVKKLEEFLEKAKKSRVKDSVAVGAGAAGVTGLGALGLGAMGGEEKEAAEKHKTGDHPRATLAWKGTTRVATKEPKAEKPQGGAAANKEEMVDADIVNAAIDKYKMKTKPQGGSPAQKVAHLDKLAFYTGYMDKLGADEKKPVAAPKAAAKPAASVAPQTQSYKEKPGVGLKSQVGGAKEPSGNIVPTPIKAAGGALKNLSNINNRKAIMRNPLADAMSTSWTPGDMLPKSTMDSLKKLYTGNTGWQKDIQNATNFPNLSAGNLQKTVSDYAVPAVNTVGQIANDARQGAFDLKDKLTGYLSGVPGIGSYFK